MGKQKKKHAGGNFHGSSQKKTCPNSPRAYDGDRAAALSLSRELKEEGNRLFQTRDYEEAMLMYERAIQLLPANDEDISHLRSNLAACHMQFEGYPRAIHECNLALEVNPKCTKALLKRSRCYEALFRLDLAHRDAKRVLEMEPNNFMAAEIAERVEAMVVENGGVFGFPVDLIPVPEYVEPPVLSASKKRSKREKKGVDGVSEPRHGKGNKLDGNLLNAPRKRGRNKKKKKKKAKNKEVSCGDNVEESGIDVTKAKKRKEKKMKKKNKNKNKRVCNGVYMKEMGIFDVEGTNDGDMSDEEETVEYNRFEILYDVELNPNDFEGVVMENNVEDGKSETETETEGLNEEKKAQDKLVVEEMKSESPEAEAKRQVKLVYGEDIRIAYIPIDCGILKLREIVCNRFPNCKAILIKYKDQEGDLITITRNEELRWADETSTVDHCYTRLHIVDVNPGQDPLLQMIKQEEEEEEEYEKPDKGIEHESEVKNVETCVDDWILQFAYLFKDYAGFESDSYLGLHEVGVKGYSEAMEETVCSEEAQYIFSAAEEKFRELASLALFNWGNVHMFRARRRRVFAGYEEDAREEYSLAGRRFEEALKMNPNFYEVIIAMGQLQFEQAKLSWYNPTTTGADDVLFLYKNAGKNMERGIQMWEEALVQHLLEVTNPCETDELLRKMKLENLFSDISAEETAERAANIRSQVKLLWGTMMYERSAMEFKLGLPCWQASLEAAADKFELAGASPDDIAVMIKNHCSNSSQGVGDVDETEQAWNEMYGAIRWQMDIPALYVDPLLQKRVRVSVTRHAPDLP